MAYRLRSAWVNPAQPVTGPTPPRTSIDTVAIHYTAANTIPDGVPGAGAAATSVAAYLRAIHNDYVTNRGYSIGYNFAVDQAGDEWELRGFTYKCAANLDHNGHCIAILVLVDGADQLSSVMLAAVRRRVDAIETWVGRRLKIIGHGQLQNPNHPTACPGAGVVAQIAAGLLSPRWVDDAITPEVTSPPVVNTPPPTTNPSAPVALNTTEVPDLFLEGDTMGYIAANADDRANPTRWYVTALCKRKIADEQEVERMKRRGLLPATFSLGNPNDPALEWMTTAQLNTYASV